MKKCKVLAICVTTVMLLGSLTGCSTNESSISLAKAIEETRKDINNLYLKELHCPHYGLLLSDVSVVFKIKAGEGGKLVVAPTVESTSVGRASYSTNSSRSNTITIKFTNFLPGLLASSSRATNKSGGSVLEKLLINSDPHSGQPTIYDEQKKMHDEQEKLRERIVQVLSSDLDMGDKSGKQMLKNDCVSSKLKNQDSPSSR